MIIGLDIGRNGRAVAVALDHLPPNIKKWFFDNRSNFLTLTPNREGIYSLLSLNPTGLVLEPTGTWYSSIWAKVAEVNNIPIYWIGHGDLSAQRQHFGFRNKRDDEDALCLAASFFDPHFVDRHGKKRFLWFYNNEKISKVRELFFEYEQLCALKIELESQLKMRLSYEFPEIAGCRFVPTEKSHIPPMIRFLAGNYNYPRIVSKYSNSIAKDLGIELSRYTKDHALLLENTYSRILSAKIGLTSVFLKTPEFEPYLEIFDSYGFGCTMKALLLINCYPIQRFLIDGKPFIEWELGKDGKEQKRDRSMRSFQAYLGLSKNIHQSGDKESLNFGGSTITRAHLYVWFLCRIAAPSGRIEKLAPYVEKWEKLREAKINGKDVIFRVLYLLTRHLYKELIRSV